MKKIDCIWELDNIGKRSIEINVEPSDIYNDDCFNNDILKKYEYIVVKVPMNMPSFNYGLTKHGFTCIETQMKISKSLNDFDFSKVDNLEENTSFKVVTDEDNLNNILENIKPGMFSTDRISIDPYFSEEIGCRRYCNWIRNEYKDKKSNLINVVYNGENVGFMLVRIEDNNIDLLLNGLYKQFQKKGLGLLTPASPLMFVRKNNLRVEHETTSISSNNIPVVKLYNKLDFKLDYQTYVFIKHNN